MSSGSIIFRQDQSIFRVNADGSNNTALAETTYPSMYADPYSLTKDGNWLLYSDGILRDSLHAVKVDGTQAVDLRTPIYSWDNENYLPISSISNPAVTPDLRYIVFNTQEALDFTTTNKLCISNFDGSNTRILVSGGEDPSISPDGSRIAYAKNGVIFTMNIDGSNSTAITPRFAAAAHPTWSPDGSYIAFDAKQSQYNHIYTIAANGTSLTQLENDSANEINPTWSPDGTAIAYSGYTSYSYNSDIFTMNKDGSNVKKIADGDSPVWASYATLPLYTLDTTSLPNTPILWANSTANLNIDLSSSTQYLSSITNSSIPGLVGGSGSDTLKGNSLDNQIWGGQGGNDTLSGGGGADVFWFGKNEGYDVITASSSNGNCSINFYDALSSDFSYSRQNDDLIIYLGGTGTLDLQGWYNSNNASNRIMHATFSDGSKF